MNTNIKTQSFLLKFILKSSFSTIHFFYLTSYLFKTIEECQHYEEQIFDKIKYDLNVQTRPPICRKHSSTFIYWPILMKICMNDNIMRTYFSLNYIWPKMHFYGMEKFLWCFYFKTFWPKYNLDLHSYGQLLSLFLNNFSIMI